jgi:hypothetical protein
MYKSVTELTSQYNRLRMNGKGLMHRDCFFWGKKGAADLRREGSLRSGPLPVAEETILSLPGTAVNPVPKKDQFVFRLPSLVGLGQGVKDVQS